MLQRVWLQITNTKESAGHYQPAFTAAENIKEGDIIKVQFLNKIGDFFYVLIMFVAGDKLQCEIVDNPNPKIPKSGLVK